MSFYKSRDQLQFFQFQNHDKYLSWLFPLPRRLYIFHSFSVGIVFRLQNLTLLTSDSDVADSLARRPPPQKVFAIVSSVVFLQLDCYHTATDSDQSHTGRIHSQIVIATLLIKVGDSTAMGCELSPSD